MGHTPGPFTRGWPDGSGKGDIVANGKRIASVIPGCSCCAKREEDMTPEDHANGDLFAAAPDLLEALHVALAAMRKVYDQTDHGHMVSDQIDYVVAAIAKAES